MKQCWSSKVIIYLLNPTFMKQDFEYIGMVVSKLHPELCKSLLKGKEKIILTDYKDIHLLCEVFSDFYEIDFPSVLPSLSMNKKSEYRTKFIALAISCYDPECITFKNKYIKRQLRKHIAQQILIDLKNISMITYYLSIARVQLNVYQDFKDELTNMVAIVKNRI